MSDVEEKPIESVAEEEKPTEKDAVEEKPAEKDSEEEKPAEKDSEEEKTAVKDSEEKSVKSDEKTENGTDKKETVKDDAVSKNADDESKAENADKNESVSRLEAQIIRQVEYYFGDSNLHRDKFLSGLIKKDTEGWVPFSVLITFKRLAVLSTDINAIVDALCKSDEGLIEISEDRTKIRRHPERPIPEQNEELRKEVMSRTCYVKGFPLDIDLDEILNFFTLYEKVVNVVMRKYIDKADKKYKFKGSVFATFEKKEQAESFIGKDGVSYKDRPLVRKWQEKYLSEKRDEREELKKKKKPNKPEEKKFDLPKDTVLHFEGVEKDIKRELIREAIENVDNEFRVAYVDFHQGDKQGHIRFHDEGTASKVLKKIPDKKVKVNDDVEITIRALSEEEETEFLAKVVEDMLKLRSVNKRGNDRSGNRKRRFGNVNNGKGKKQKYDD